MCDLQKLELSYINFVLCFQLSDVDSDTIQRQRRELQLLIGELKDRDRYCTYTCSFNFINVMKYFNLFIAYSNLPVFVSEQNHHGLRKKVVKLIMFDVLLTSICLL